MTKKWSDQRTPGVKRDSSPGWRRRYLLSLVVLGVYYRLYFWRRKGPLRLDYDRVVDTRQQEAFTFLIYSFREDLLLKEWEKVFNL